MAGGASGVTRLPFGERRRGSVYCKARPQRAQQQLSGWVPPERRAPLSRAEAWRGWGPGGAGAPVRGHRGRYHNLNWPSTSQKQASVFASLARGGWVGGHNWKGPDVNRQSSGQSHPPPETKIRSSTNITGNQDDRGSS